jgi:SAM-dependent methyltransferase
MLGKRHEYLKMASVEGSLWWYRDLHALVLATIRHCSVGTHAALVDAGCGTGGLIQYLAAHGYTSLRGFDLSEDAVAVCRERGLPVVQSDLLSIARLYERASLDAVVSNDILCYLDPDEQARWVEQCADVIKPGGVLMMNLPALPVFRGTHDVSVGIRHRFSRLDVTRLFAGKPFAVTNEIYWPFLLAPVIGLMRWRQRRRLEREPSLPVESDIDPPPAFVNELLYQLVAAENRLLRRKPFGSSLFVVAVRRGR